MAPTLRVCYQASMVSRRSSTAAGVSAWLPVRGESPPPNRIEAQEWGVWQEGIAAIECVPVRGELIEQGEAIRLLLEV